MNARLDSPLERFTIPVTGSQKSEFLMHTGASDSPSFFRRTHKERSEKCKADNYYTITVEILSSSWYFDHFRNNSPTFALK